MTVAPEAERGIGEGVDAGASSGWEALARRAARAFTAPAAVEDRRELLCVEVAGADYAIPVERVREIVRLTSITRIPRTPAWLVGVIALRGQMIEVVDLRHRLGLEPVAITRRSRIVLVHGDDDSIAGLLVDAVSGVMRVAERDAIPTPPAELRSVVEMVRAGDDFVGVLDLARVVGLLDD
jgi:purine-binding chemotaxis protein CheW